MKSNGTTNQSYYRRVVTSISNLATRRKIKRLYLRCKQQYTDDNYYGLEENDILRIYNNWQELSPEERKDYWKEELEILNISKTKEIEPTELTEDLKKLDNTWNNANDENQFKLYIDINNQNLISSMEASQRTVKMYQEAEEEEEQLMKEFRAQLQQQKA